MSKARLFVVAHFLFLTGPVALIASAWAAGRTGHEWLPFLALLPYMAIALLVQLFRCPACGEGVYTLKRAAEIGYKEYLTPRLPRLTMRCPKCSASFWRADQPPA